MDAGEKRHTARKTAAVTHPYKPFGPGFIWKCYRRSVAQGVPHHTRLRSVGTYTDIVIAIALAQAYLALEVP